MKNIFIYITLIISLYSTVISSPKWYIEVVDNTDCVGDYTSIELDSNDNPHISYNEFNYDGELRYAYFDGYKWNWEIVDNNGNIQGSTSLALDSKNHPHISYTGNGNLMYAYFDGSEWHKEIIDNYCGYTSIALDSKEHPHISYYKGNPNDDLKYTYFDGSKWIITRVDTEGSVGWGSSIVIDSYNYPHIAYADITNDFIKYAYWDGRSWIISKVDDSDGGGLPSLALDSKDLPHISYIYWVDYDPNEKLKYVYNNGSKWVTSVVDVSSGPISYQSLDLDKSYFPHIAYEKFDNLYYARYGYGIGIDLTSFSAVPHNKDITLNWSVIADENISGFNLYRRIIAPFTVSTVRENSYSPTCSPATVGEIAQYPPNPDNDYVWTKVNKSLITGTNPYSYTDRDILPDINYEYKLEAVVSDKAETLGTTECTSGNRTPGSFYIARIYPTPASSQISIDVIIPSQAEIDIAIYDITGRCVSRVAKGLYNEGEYTITGDVSGLANDVYIVRMTGEDLSASKRFVVAK